MGSQLETKLLRLVGKASNDFDLIAPDDRIMVGVSGGKDSYTLLHLLRQIQRKVPFDFSLVAVNLDQGHPGFPADMLRGWFESEGYEYRMIAHDTYSIVQEKVPAGKTYCSMCSRLRRGILYNLAEELGATKISLGHHRDDIIETLMLNLLYSGQLKAMPVRKFDETVELNFYLGIDGRQADQALRGTVMLPNGTGNEVRIVVITQGELVAQVEEAGADHVGAADLIAKIEGGWLDFDLVIRVDLIGRLDLGRHDHPP